jgi:hypothetical protein
MKNITTIVLMSVSMLACGPRETISRETFEQVNQSMEVKRLTEVEIIEEAMIWGDSITSKAQSQLMTALHQAIEDEGAAGAVEFCNLNALPIVEEVEDSYQVKIRRVSNRNRNPENLPKPDEKDILEAYEFAAETGEKPDPNIQKLAGGDILLFTKPIVISSAICLNCHGKPDENLEKNTAEKLRELYPQDKATDFKIGDLRGMWSVRIPKSEVVKRL